LGLGMCEIKFLEDSPKILREYSYFFIIVPWQPVPWQKHGADTDEEPEGTEVCSLVES
jgi:hypothetical protein